MFGYGELFRDLEIIKSFAVSTQTKKELVNKYGCKSKKAAEIINRIYEEFAVLRCAQTEFSIEDRILWLKSPKSSSVERLSGLKKAFEGECDAFKNYLREYYSNAKEGTRGFKIHKAIESYFNEIDNSKDKSLQDLIFKIKSELKDYHETYIEANKKFLSNKYIKDKEFVDSYQPIKQKIKQKYPDTYREEKEYLYFQTNVYPRYKKLFYELYGMTLETYVEKGLKLAEETWERDINEIAFRVRKKNINENNLKIVNPKTDPKFIELQITDGVNTLWARSIIAALDSVLVRPHYRFILT